MFTALGSNGTVTPVTINSTLEVTNANEQPVPVNRVNGFVTIGGSTGSNKLLLALTDKTAATNSDVCLDMAVTNFAGIVGMEFNLAYNPDSLTFKSVGSLNLSGLEASNFGLPGVGLINWQHQTGLGGSGGFRGYPGRHGEYLSGVLHRESRFRGCPGAF